MSATPPAAEGSGPYLLGSHPAEWKRLELQHRLWKEPTDRLMTKADFGPGQRLWDLGCGPGFTTLDLARRVGATGEVVGRDLDGASLKHLEQLAASENHLRMRAEQADAAAPIPSAHGLDGIFTRWLLCWLADVPAVLRACADALLPGGRLAIFDYLHYASLDLLPASPAFRHGIDAVQARWRASGGDPDIGARLPRLCHQAGLQVIHQEVLCFAVRPADALWQWPTSFFPGFMAQLVQGGDLEAEAAQAFLTSWRAAEDDPDGLFITPPMLSLVARKR